MNRENDFGSEKVCPKTCLVDIMSVQPLNGPSLDFLDLHILLYTPIPVVNDRLFVSHILRLALAALYSSFLVSFVLKELHPWRLKCIKMEQIWQ